MKAWSKMCLQMDDDKISENTKRECAIVWEEELIETKWKREREWGSVDVVSPFAVSHSKWLCVLDVYKLVGPILSKASKMIWMTERDSRTAMCHGIKMWKCTNGHARKTESDTKSKQNDSRTPVRICLQNGLTYTAHTENIHTHLFYLSRVVTMIVRVYRHNILSK